MTGELTQRFALPTDARPGVLGQAIDGCLAVLGEDLHAVMDETLTVAYGPNWAPHVQSLQKGNGQAGPRDTMLLLKEILRHGTPVATVLPSSTKWRDAVRQVLALRHAKSHYDPALLEGGITDSLMAAVDSMRYVAGGAHLPCHGEINQVRQRLAAIRGGEVFGEGAAYAQTLAERDDAARLAQDLQREVGAAQAQLDAAKQVAANAAERAQRAEAKASTATQREEAKDAEIARLNRALRQAAAGEAERAQLREQLRVAEGQRARLEADAQEAQEALEAVAEQQDYFNDDIKRLTTLVRDLAATVESTAAGAPSGPSAPTGSGLPEPGQPWPYGPGQQRWRLSKRYRSLVRPSDNMNLADMVGQARAAELVAQFLALRPEGGQVMVDSDKDAVTFTGTQWMYLGRLEAHAAAPVPTPGTPADAQTQVSGRKFTMWADGEVTHAGKELAQVVGAERATQVRDRIRALKPSGGKLWVQRSGLVTGYVDAQLVVITTLARDEWFGGCID